MEIKTLSDRCYDNLYMELLKATRINKLDASKYNLAEVGFLRTVDIINKNKDISNNNLYYLCNNIPAVSTSYIPSGDLINSYSLFLNHLIPTNISKENKVAHAMLSSQKIEIEKQITNLVKEVRRKGDTKKFDANKKYTDTIHGLLKSMRKHEARIGQIVNTKMKTNQHVNSKNPNSLLYEALAAVSFLTGARKINGENIFNMPVNTDPQLVNHSYSPRYKIIGLSEVLPKWQEKSSRGEYTYKIKVTTSSKAKNTDKEISKLKIFRFDEPNNKKKKTNLDSEEFNLYEVDMSFSGLGVFPVSPVNWFEPTFFKQKEFSLLPNSPNFFGHKGSLEAIPISLLLGFNLDLQIKISSKEFKNFNKTIDNLKSASNLGLSVGRYEFIVSGSKKNTNVKKNSESGTIHLSLANSNLPNLLGVISKKVMPYIISDDEWGK